MHPFVSGESYDREDVLRFPGSKQNQSGIVFGSNLSSRAVITGGRSLSWNEASGLF